MDLAATIPFNVLRIGLTLVPRLKAQEERFDLIVARKLFEHAPSLPFDLIVVETGVIEIHWLPMAISTLEPADLLIWWEDARGVRYPLGRNPRIYNFCDAREEEDCPRWNSTIKIEADGTQGLPITTRSDGRPTSAASIVFSSDAEVKARVVTAGEELPPVRFGLFGAFGNPTVQLDDFSATSEAPDGTITDLQAELVEGCIHQVRLPADVIGKAGVHTIRLSIAGAPIRGSPMMCSVKPGVGVGKMSNLQRTDAPTVIGTPYTAVVIAKDKVRPNSQTHDRRSMRPTIDRRTVPVMWAVRQPSRLRRSKRADTCPRAEHFGFDRSRQRGRYLQRALHAI